jgi:hypothetical protein
MLLDLHHTLHWTSVLIKQARFQAQITRTQTWTPTGICFDSLNSLTYWLWFCVGWSPINGGIMFMLLIFEIHWVHDEHQNFQLLISQIIEI